MKPHLLTALMLSAMLAACNSGGPANVPGDASSTKPYAGIGEEGLLHFSGAEPFWGGTVKAAQLTYNTPDDIAGVTLVVERFAGRGGLSYSGVLNDQSFDMAVTEGACSDGMSDRLYPFVVTLRLGDDLRNGCGWSDSRPFEGAEAP